ncbi:TetR/AcrR family transcriptional regulator [Spirillospora sp. NBC_01491]|uniref:TetR/AcrR family transcriptional regulator n=1 Tax=Spirillospora sp. NBC_01491 TaxID=2976007 RepID=UPI002E37611C|nr:TetR/AcrR family transcriptional regulator [Spirillospora sp. NBC_01491]
MDGSQATGRRAEYAEATRAAIVQAARALFAQQGYFATTVEQIAKQARVAPATVYAVTGGKKGLIVILSDIWGADPILRSSLDRLAGLDDPAQILRLVASASRQVREKYGDIMRVMLATGPHDSVAAEKLRLSTHRYRGTLATVAGRLDELGGLAPGIDARRAADVLWFYFGYSGYFTLLDDTGWSFSKAEQWLFDQCAAALLYPNSPAFLDDGSARA